MFSFLDKNGNDNNVQEYNKIIDHQTEKLFEIMYKYEAFDRDLKDKWVNNNNLGGLIPKTKKSSNNNLLIKTQNSEKFIRTICKEFVELYFAFITKNQNYKGIFKTENNTNNNFNVKRIINILD